MLGIPPRRPVRLNELPHRIVPGDAAGLLKPLAGPQGVTVVYGAIFSAAKRARFCGQSAKDSGHYRRGTTFLKAGEATAPLNAEPRLCFSRSD
jgi:hypothetical protein